MPAQMQEADHVAIGCVLFAVKEQHTRSPRQYLDAIKSELEKIENIGNIQFSGENREYGAGFLPVDTRKESFIGHFYWNLIKFQIYIPFRLQEELGFVCNDEHIDVVITSGYDFPFTLFPYKGGDGRASDNARVALVREYLRSRLDGNSEVSVFCIGPSPFHADFELVGDRDEQLLVDCTQGPGYKNYQFYHPGRHGLFDFQARYSDVIALFYYLTHLRSKMFDESREMWKNIQELVERDGGIFRDIADYRKIRRSIDDVNRAILKISTLKSEIRSALERAEAEYYDCRFEDLKSHFYDLYKCSEDGSEDSAKETVRLFENRNISLIQNGFVLVAGLLGGLVGSLVTTALN